jgi:hypothetical protein
MPVGTRQGCLLSSLLFSCTKVIKKDQKEETKAFLLQIIVSIKKKKIQGLYKTAISKLARLCDPS